MKFNFKLFNTENSADFIINYVSFIKKVYIVSKPTKTRDAEISYKKNSRKLNYFIADRQKNRSKIG